MSIRDRNRTTTAKPDRRHVALAKLVGPERRLFTYAEALCAGFDPEAIRRRRAHNVWLEISPYVMCAAPIGRLSPLEELLAHTLSGDAHACRGSTLALFDLCSFPSLPNIVVTRSRRNLNRKSLHSSRSLPPIDLTTERHVSTTTVARALIDVATPLSDQRVQQLIAKAIVRRKVRGEELSERAEALRAGRAGAARVARVVAALDPDLSNSYNEWEVLVTDFAAKHGLPTPQRNYRVELEHGPRYVDVAWPEVKCGIEYDGYWEHLTSMDRFVDDRFRDIDFKNSGWRIDHCNKQMLDGAAARIFEPTLRAFERRVA